MKSLSFSVIGIIACIALAQTATFGTQVTPSWYDRVATLYQSPVFKASQMGEATIFTNDAGERNGYDWSRAEFPNLYTNLRYFVYVEPSSDGKNGTLITSNPDSAEVRARNLAFVKNSNCILIGEAREAEILISNAVYGLQNAVDNDALKQMIIEIGEADKVYLTYSDETYIDPAQQTLNAVAVGTGVRVAADKIIISYKRIQVQQGVTNYMVVYKAEFSIKRLRDMGALQGTKVIFQHGWKKSDFCPFDLGLLP